MSNKMFYFKFIAETPYCGTTNTDYYDFEELPTDAELDEMAEEICQKNAESFEYLVTGWDDDVFEDEDERTEALDDYYADCTCTWEEISEEEFEENS